jgi:hypothetical protein
VYSRVFAAVPDDKLATIPVTALARLRPFPILNASELAVLKSHIRRIGSYAHFLHRADRLLARIQAVLRTDDPDYDAIILGVVPGLYEAIRADAPSLGLKRSGLLPTNVKVSDLHSALRLTDAQFDPGYLCPERECFVYRDNSSTLEIVSDGEFAIEVRMSGEIANLFGKPEFRAIASIISGAVDADGDTLIRNTGELSKECKGRYKFLTGKDGVHGLFLAKPATDNYVSLRFLRVK